MRSGDRREGRILFVDRPQIKERYHMEKINGLYHILDKDDLIAIARNREFALYVCSIANIESEYYWGDEDE